MEPVNVLQSIVPEVTGILQGAGYFDKGHKGALRDDDATLRRLLKAVDAKNHRLAEVMWSNDPDMLASLPQFQTLKGHLNNTDMKRILKEVNREPLDHRAFARRIDESYLVSPTRIKRIERSELHITGLMNNQRAARKEKLKFKFWIIHPSACPICRMMAGQKVGINKPYSNGSYVAHGHPQCLCEDGYTNEKSP